MIEKAISRPEPAFSRAAWMLPLFVGAHALTILGLAQHRWGASLSFLTLAPLLAGAACVWRARRGAFAGGWAMLAFAMLLWAGGMAGNVLAGWWLGSWTGVAGVSMLLFILYGVPVILVAASTQRETRPVRLIDAVLVLVLGYLFFRQTFAFATMEGASDAGVAGLRLMFDIENLFVALVALVRLVASRGAAERRFFRALAVYAFVYLGTAGYINHMQSDADYGSWSDLIIPLPFLVLSVLALADPFPGHRVRGDGEGFVRVVRAGGPVLLPISLLVVSGALVGGFPQLAIAGCAIAVFGYGARTILVQLGGQRVRDELQHMLLIDALTGLANRRAFDQSFAREWGRLRRGGGGVALLMIDVDHFKMLNDSFGHPVGDQRLRAVAKALADGAAAATDTVARYGGEEFAVILSDVTTQEAIARAEALRASIEALALPSPAAGGRVTVSIGVAHAAHAADGGPAALMAAADTALYDAKQAGRNRTRAAA